MSGRFGLAVIVLEQSTQSLLKITEVAHANSVDLIHADACVWRVPKFTPRLGNSQGSARYQMPGLDSDPCGGTRFARTAENDSLSG